MIDLPLLSKRRGWVPLGLVFVAWGAMAACNGSTDGDDNTATGGGPTSGGAPSSGGAGGADGGGPASGGEPSDGGAGGDSCLGRRIDGDIISGVGGAIALVCRDIECEGHCETGHHCNQNVVCEDDEQIYCDTHGRNFVGNSNCAQWSIQYEGECQLFNCDLRDVPCDAPAPTHYCGMAREVVDGQLGPCIPVPQCACSSDAECPDPQTQGCTSEGHCEYRSRIPD